jgi:ABC-3C biological conflict system middle component
MKNGLASEFESMRNIGLAAEALRAYVTGFESVQQKDPAHVVTMWHLATVLPLVFDQASRRAISKRQVPSGLRSILTRDPENDIAQNEAIFNVNGRMRSMYRRTLRALNCAISWGLLATSGGAFVTVTAKPRKWPKGEAEEVLKAAKKLGTWSGQNSNFEYFSILGVEVRR